MSQGSRPKSVSDSCLHASIEPLNRALPAQWSELDVLRRTCHYNKPVAFSYQKNWSSKPELCKNLERGRDHSTISNPLCQVNNKIPSQPKQTNIRDQTDTMSHQSSQYGGQGNQFLVDRRRDFIEENDIAGASPVGNTQAKRIAFMSGNDDFRAARLRCALACQEYNKLSEDVSIEDRVKGWMW